MSHRPEFSSSVRDSILTLVYEIWYTLFSKDGLIFFSSLSLDLMMVTASHLPRMEMCKKLKQLLFLNWTITYWTLHCRFVHLVCFIAICFDSLKSSRQSGGPNSTSSSNFCSQESSDAQENPLHLRDPTQEFMSYKQRLRSH